MSFIRTFPFPRARVMIRSYPGKSSIVSEFESSRGTTEIKRRMQSKTYMEDATIWQIDKSNEDLPQRC